MSILVKACVIVCFGYFMMLLLYTYAFLFHCLLGASFFSKYCTTTLLGTPMGIFEIELFIGLYKIDICNLLLVSIYIIGKGYLIILGVPAYHSASAISPKCASWSSASLYD